MTIREAIRRGSEMLAPRGDAFLVSEVLLAYLLGRPKEWLLAHPEESFSDEVFEFFLAHLRQIGAGKPLAQITHSKEFFGFELYVDERVLIPRPETEHLVEEVLSRFSKDDELTIADVGTGSGCITVALARNLPRANFLALDISEDALRVARRNFDHYKLQDRVKIVHSDLLNKVLDQKIDVVVANLPYIGEKFNRFVDNNVVEFEPNIALFGGEDGLDLYKKMFQQIKQMKYRPSLIVGEFGFAQGEALRVLLNQFFDQKSEIIKDYSGIERVFIIF